MDRRPDPKAALVARRKYAEAFDDTLISIWEEKQFKLFGPRAKYLEARKRFGSRYNWRRAGTRPSTLRAARRTGALIASTRAVAFSHDDGYSDLTFRQKFLEYGIYVDAGTGREVPRGNPGDIGREKVRKPKPWFSRKYFMSVMNLRDFYADNLGLRTVGLLADAINDRSLRGGVSDDGAFVNGTYVGPGSNFTNGLAIDGLNMPL